MTSERRRCPVCGAALDPFARAVILSRHDVQYFRCPRCGLVTTETPFWLEEAYATAISPRDIGLIARCLENAATTEALILASGMDPGDRFLDFAGGYGIFTRIMRDRGFDFWHTDPYCANLFAVDFGASDGSAGYALVTAFEVLEHLDDPATGLEEMLSRGSSVFATTQLLPDPAPKPGHWWYYDTESGQHVTFLTRKALTLLAERFGCGLVSDGVSRHFFYRAHARALPLRVRLAYSGRSRALVTRLLARRKRTETLLTADAADLLNPTRPVPEDSDDGASLSGPAPPRTPLQ